MFSDEKRASISEKRGSLKDKRPESTTIRNKFNLDKVDERAVMEPEIVKKDMPKRK